MALATHATSSQSDQGLDRERFRALWKRCAGGAPGSDGSEVFERLLERYREPHRCYHTPDHIRHCLEQFDLARGDLHDPDAVELALWFHDAIYETPGPDNEVRSAEWFRSVARSDLDAALCEHVYAMIMVTVHPSQPVDADERIVVDIDLSSFALPWERFKRDSEAVRREMQHMTDDEFFSGQIRFLESLLNRGSFFCSPFFKRRSEAAARDNVTRYLSELRERGFSATP